MKFANYKKVELLLNQTLTTPRRTRSQDAKSSEDETIPKASTFPSRYHPKNIAIEVTPGKNKMYTKQSAGKYHEFFLDSIDVFCQVLDRDDWLPNISNEPRTKGVFIPLKHFNHEMSPTILNTFGLSFLNNKSKGATSTTTKHYKFGISFYPSCVDCGMNVILGDFFKRVFVNNEEYEYILKSCSHKETKALCLVHRSLKFDKSSESWIFEETILSAITFQLHNHKKFGGAFVLHRATSHMKLNEIISHDNDYDNFKVPFRGLGFGFLLMEILHTLSYTITASMNIYLGCPDESIRHYVEMGFEHVTGNWQSLPKWVKQLAQLEGDDENFYLAPCRLTEQALVPPRIDNSRIFQLFFEEQKRDLKKENDQHSNQKNLFKKIYEPAYEVYLNDVLTQKTSIDKIDIIRKKIDENPCSETWNLFKNFGDLDFFPWFSYVLDKYESYIKKGTRGYKDMFGLEHAILQYFAVKPIHYQKEEVRFQLQCTNCKKPIIDKPLPRETFCKYAGSIMEKHIFGIRKKNQLAFSNDDIAEDFHSQDIHVIRCSNFYIPSKIRHLLKVMMHDLLLKRYEVPDICKITHASCCALVEIITDDKNIQKLQDYMILSNKENIINIENYLLKRNKMVKHDFNELLAKKSSVIQESLQLINQKMVDTSFSGPSNLPMRNENKSNTTDESLVYYWTHIELVDPKERHPSAAYPSGFPQLWIDQKKPYYMGYSNLNVGGVKKEYSFLAHQNYTGSLDYSTSGELSMDFMRQLKKNVKTEIPKTERKIVLQNAIIASRKVKLYSVTMKVRPKGNIGSKKLSFGMTFDLVAKEFMMGAEYVVDKKHILKMFEASHPEYIQKLFDIRNVGKEMLCPITDEIESKRATLLYTMDQEQNRSATKPSLAEHKKLYSQDLSNKNPSKRKSSEPIEQLQKKSKITPLIEYKKTSFLKPAAKTNEKVLDQPYISTPSKDNAPNETASESSVHKPSDTEHLEYEDNYSPPSDEIDDDDEPAQIVQDPTVTEILDDDTDSSSSSDESSVTTKPTKSSEKVIETVVEKDSQNLLAGINASIQEHMEQYKARLEERKKGVSLIDKEIADEYFEKMARTKKKLHTKFMTAVEKQKREREKQDLVEKDIIAKKASKEPAKRKSSKKTVSPKKLKMKSASKTIIVAETPSPTSAKKQKLMETHTHDPLFEEQSVDKIVEKSKAASKKQNLIQSSKAMSHVVEKNNDPNIMVTHVHEGNKLSESIPDEKNVDPAYLPFLTEMKKLTFTGASLSSGFWDNMLNVIRHRKSFATLFQQVDRFRLLELDRVKSECRLNARVFHKQCWKDYPREPKFYMMLVEIVTHYFFKFKYWNRDFKDDMFQDLTLMSTNTIYAIVFFGNSTSETYTAFTANRVLYACGVFESEKEVFDGIDKMTDFLALKRLDSYDLFEFKLGQMSTSDVMVKYEDVQGAGSADKPIEFD